MSAFFLVTKIEYCDTLDRVQYIKQTFSFPVRWFQVLDIIEDIEVEYDLEEGEIYESTKTKNSLAAANFLASLVYILNSNYISLFEH
jgi:hypothetical protein